YDPADPTFTLGAARNAAGPFGATIAALLRGVVGAGAFVLVPALGLLGIRLLLGSRAPGLRPRFWIGAGLLVVVLASLPPLLGALAPGRLAAGGGGARQ